MRGKEQRDRERNRLRERQQEGTGHKQSDQKSISTNGMRQAGEGNAGMLQLHETNH